MDDVELRRAQEQQCCAKLLCELAREVQRYTTEVGVAQEVVQVV